MAMDTSVHKPPKQYKLCCEADFEYNTSVPSRGVAVIITNFEFGQETLADKTEMDSYVEKLFAALNYVEFTEIRRHDNLTAGQMIEVLDAASRFEYLKRRACILVVVMSFGDEPKVYGTEGTISFDDLMEPLNVKSMEGIPKILLVQNTSSDLATTENTDVTHQLENDSLPYGPAEPYPVYKVSDILLCYSIHAGFRFINAFCHVLRRHGRKLDIVQILTRVSRLMGYFPDGSKRPVGSDQCPYLLSLLTKTLYFP